MTAGLRISAFDLDGTTFRQGAFLPGLDVGLSRLRERGVRSFLLTGRTAVAFQGVARVAPALTGFEDSILLSHGNLRLRRAGGAVEIMRALPNDVPDRLAADGAWDLVVEASEVLVANSRKAAAAYALAYDLPRSTLVINPQGTAGEFGPALSVTVFGGVDRLAGCLAGLEYELDRLSAYRAHVIRPAGTCKANALDRFLASETAGTVGLANVIAFGDARNDSCLLGAAGYGVAVQEADEIAVRHSRLWLDQPLAGFLTDFEPGSVSPRTTVGTQPPCVGAHLDPSSGRNG